MEIHTTRGLTILIDDDDWGLVGKFSWYANQASAGRFYAYARVDTKTRISMHRLIMNPPDGLVVHHKNNNGLDNRRQNLEITTQSYNMRAKNFSRAVGVHQHRGTGRWRAQLRIDGKVISFGIHDTKEAAEDALRRARDNRDGL